MKTIFGRKQQDTPDQQDDQETGGPSFNEEDAPGAIGGVPSEESTSTVSTKKGARFSDDTVDKPKKGGLRFAEPPPPSSSSGKKKEKKRVVMVMDDEEGKKKAKPTADKPKRDKKEPVPPVSSVGFSAF